MAERNPLLVLAVSLPRPTRFSCPKSCKASRGEGQEERSEEGGPPQRRRPLLRRQQRPRRATGIRRGRRQERPPRRQAGMGGGVATRPRKRCTADVGTGAAVVLAWTISCTPRRRFLRPARSWTSSRLLLRLRETRWVLVLLVFTIGRPGRNVPPPLCSLFTCILVSGVGFPLPIP